MLSILVLQLEPDLLLAQQKIISIAMIVFAGFLFVEIALAAFIALTQISWDLDYKLEKLMRSFCSGRFTRDRDIQKNTRELLLIQTAIRKYIDKQKTTLANISRKQAELQTAGILLSSLQHLKSNTIIRTTAKWRKQLSVIIHLMSIVHPTKSQHSMPSKQFTGMYNLAYEMFLLLEKTKSDLATYNTNSKVLVFADPSTFLTRLELTLQDLWINYRIRSVSDAAHKDIQIIRPQAIIIDPDFAGGMQLLTKLKTDTHTQYIPVITLPRPTRENLVSQLTSIVV